MNVNYRAFLCLSAVISLMLFFVFSPGPAFAEEPFYKGKTIALVQGREPGGTGDMRVRALIPFLQKYIPGNPTIVSEYMPGGGGRKAANFIFKGARPDGLTMGNVGAGLVANAILGETGVQYDLDKLIYLGTPNSESHYLFYTKSDLGLTSLEKLRGYSGLRIGGQTVNHDIYIFGRIFSWLLDLKNPRFITGYSGPELDIALTRGELDGRANLATTFLKRYPDWTEKRAVNLHAIIAIPREDKMAAFSSLPELDSFVRSPREAKLLSLHRSFRLGGSPYILPPGTPKAQAQILRTAMSKAFKDPSFTKEFLKLTGNDPSPLTGDQLEKYIGEIPRDPDILELFSKIGGSEPLPPR